MKERIKSIVLAALVISNFILGSQVLSTKKLWSDDGYNFFVNFTNNPVSNLIDLIKNKFTGSAPIETHLESPEILIINTGYQTSRLALSRTNEEFTAVLDALNEFLLDAFSSPQKFFQASLDDLHAALTTKSVYMRYPADYDSTLFAYLLGAGSLDYSQVFSQLRDIVVSADGNVWVTDSLTGIVYRCPTAVSTIALSDVIDSHASENEQSSVIINYAFDLGFDTALMTQRTVLSPMIPIYSGDFNINTVTASNPLAGSNNLNAPSVTNLLKLFNMNPNILRRYTEADGTTVFVENNAILKLSPNGTIDYTAKSNGVQISKSNSSSHYDSISQIAEFVDSINTAVNSESMMQLSSDITAKQLSQDSLVVALDYLANGFSVKLDNGSLQNAVIIEIKDGRIINYRQLLRSYSVDENTITIPDYITALDDAISKYENQLNDIEISKIDIAYSDDGSDGEKQPFWNVGVKEIVITG